MHAVTYCHFFIHGLLCIQVRDMTAFVIHYCIITHIKITIQSLYGDPLQYYDHNTDPPFLLIISFIILPYRHVDIAKALINIYE